MQNKINVLILHSYSIREVIHCLCVMQFSFSCLIFSKLICYTSDHHNILQFISVMYLPLFTTCSIQCCKQHLSIGITIILENICTSEKFHFNVYSLLILKFWKLYHILFINSTYNVRTP